MLSHQFRIGRSALAVMLAAIGALAMLAVSGPSASAAETSIFIAYPQTGFGGNPVDINGCGGHNLPTTVNSYQWVARGQTGYMYNQTNEQGVIETTLSSDQDASQKTHVGWKSIFIVC
jgi:hypothetical protein